jgi:DNA-binding MarR family transcriptional regulator
MNEPGALSAALLCTLRSVESRLEAALEPLGLSLAKFGVLSKLVAAGEPLPLSTLAERSACVRSNITQLVDRLEADRLVVRAPDPKDRRSIRAELTEQGRARQAEASRVVTEAEKAVFSGLPEGHAERLSRRAGDVFSRIIVQCCIVYACNLERSNGSRRSKELPQ